MSIQGLDHTHVDLTKIPSIEPNRLVGFINNFASIMVQQLSNLNNAADLRLFQLHSRIVMCKTNLWLLEKKLASVDGLSDTPANNTMTTTTEPPEPTTETSSEVIVEVDRAEVQNADVEEEETDGAQAGGKDDPELCRFYKMLKVGVPLPAVRMKMVSEGVDPDRLHL